MEMSYNYHIIIAGKFGRLPRICVSKDIGRFRNFANRYSIVIRIVICV